MSTDHTVTDRNRKTYKIHNNSNDINDYYWLVNTSVYNRLKTHKRVN